MKERYLLVYSTKRKLPRLRQHKHDIHMHLLKW